MRVILKVQLDEVLDWMSTVKVLVAQALPCPAATISSRARRLRKSLIVLVLIYLSFFYFLFSSLSIRIIKGPKYLVGMVAVIAPGTDELPSQQPEDRQSDDKEDNLFAFHSIFLFFRLQK